MAVLVKENQALAFDIATNCGCGGNYCQPIQTDDSCFLQTVLTAANNNNLCTNGEFDESPGGWTLNGNFTISSGALHGTNETGSEAISPYMGLVAGRVYLIQTSVTVTSVGSAGAGEGWYIKVNGDYLQLPSISLGGGYNASLAASWLYIPSSITTDTLNFGTNESTIDFDVSYVRVYEFSTPGMAIYDNSSNLLSVTTSWDGDNAIEFIHNSTKVLNGVKSELFEGEYAYNGVSIVANIYISAWATLTSYTGCINITLFDAVYSYNRIRNGTFDNDLLLWDEGAQWEWDGGGKAWYNPPGSGSYTAGVLAQDITLMGGLIYTLSFNLTNIGFDNMQVLIDKNDGMPTATPITGVQTPYQMKIDMTAFTGVQTVTVSFGEYTTANGDFKIDTVSVTADSYTGSESGCIDLQTSHSCTLLFFGSNSDAAFGFAYGGGFRQWLRVYGKQKIHAYPEEVEHP